MKSIVIGVFSALMFSLSPPDSCAAVLQQDIELPISDNAGGEVRAHVRICEPDDSNPHPVLLFVHGNPGKRGRPKSEVPACSSETNAWFTQRGFAVVFPLRLGFGATGGPYLEGNGECSEADYVRDGREIARQTDAVARYLAGRPDMDSNRIVVLGHSTGGWGALAYDGMDHPGVVGFINMAGGNGGHYRGVKNRVCRVDQLNAAVSRFGANAKTPMLWIYAKNDSFFGPDLAQVWFTRFTQAGGVATLEQLGPFGADGHMLLFERGGSASWGPRVAAFLNSLGLNVPGGAIRQ